MADNQIKFQVLVNGLEEIQRLLGMTKDVNDKLSGQVSSNTANFQKTVDNLKNATAEFDKLTKFLENSKDKISDIGTKMSSIEFIKKANIDAAIQNLSVFENKIKDINARIGQEDSIIALTKDPSLRGLAEKRKQTLQAEATILGVQKDKAAADIESISQGKDPKIHAEETGKSVADHLTRFFTGRAASILSGAVGSTLGQQLGGPFGSLIGAGLGQSTSYLIGSTGIAGLGLGAMGMAAYGAYQYGSYLYDPRAVGQRQLGYWGHQRQASEEALSGDYTRMMLRSGMGTAERIAAGEDVGFAPKNYFNRAITQWQYWLGAGAQGESYEDYRARKFREEYEDTDKAQIEFLSQGQKAQLNLSRSFAEENRQVGHDAFTESVIALGRKGVNVNVADPMIRAVSKWQGRMLSENESDFATIMRDYGVTQGLVEQIARRGRGTAGTTAAQQNQALGLMGAAGITTRAGQNVFSDYLAQAAQNYSADYSLAGVGAMATNLAANTRESLTQRGFSDIDINKSAALSAQDIGRKGETTGSMLNNVQISFIMKEYGVPYEVAAIAAAKGLNNSDVRNMLAGYISEKTGKRVTGADIGKGIGTAWSKTLNEFTGQFEDPLFEKHFKHSMQAGLLAPDIKDTGRIITGAEQELKGTAFDTKDIVGKAPSKAKETLADKSDEQLAKTSAQLLSAAGTDLSDSAKKLKEAAEKQMEVIQMQMDTFNKAVADKHAETTRSLKDVNAVSGPTGKKMADPNKLKMGILDK